MSIPPGSALGRLSGLGKSADPNGKVQGFSALHLVGSPGCSLEGGECPCKGLRIAVREKKGFSPHIDEALRGVPTPSLSADAWGAASPFSKLPVGIGLRLPAGTTLRWSKSFSPTVLALLGWTASGAQCPPAGNEALSWVESNMSLSKDEMLPIQRAIQHGYWSVAQAGSARAV